ncbi:P22 phage major capsid protein family protein [Actinocrispum wychmicini]|uniref:P22 coat protein Gp5 n=1 Tax=Actinocrispum wychmicini TaxID=1213861 RepID=A0A4R2JVA0_9PSEU|nr:P22 phage major capsid protein family protein [Actinocrispum wychmicini]TCO64381.1 P22 coat protein Gp5 [Actinocrispum wychmicini]
MPNQLLTVNVIAREAIATLYEATVMAGLVHRDYEGDFTGNSGDTITIRKPATFTVTEFNRATGIVLQDVKESSTSLTLNKIPDISFAVTSEDWSMRITDFSEQFLQPAMEAISQYTDRLVLGLRADITQLVEYNPTAPNPSDVLVDAGKVLNDANVDTAQRRAVADTTLTALFQKDPLFTQAQQVGDDGTALREASIGRKRGFDNYMSQNVKDGVSLAFRREAFALVTRTLPLPRGIGAGQGSIVTYKGLGLRVIYGYDMTKKQDVVSIDCLMGVKTLDPKRAVLIKRKAGA